MIPRPLHRRLSSEQRSALVASYTAGVRQKDLAVKYGISVRSVKRLVQRARTAESI
ncbi:sigma factor-like helix-turn-helix DNA-binding protein [Glycomyces sp. NPDC047369]